MKFTEARKFVLNRLGTELPLNLYYHGIHHTLDVCNAVDEISKEENIEGEELQLLRTAAVLHDVGFIEQYLNNEPIAVKIARQILPDFDYTPTQIEIVANIILCTQIPQHPQSTLEKIMCDADLDYLGRPDFFEISETLKKEWFAYGLVSSDEEYNEKQIRFFEQHHYFTRTARERREEQKQNHLTILKKQS